MTDFERLHRLATKAEQFRATPIIDDDFTEYRDRFDSELRSVQAYIKHRAETPVIVCLCGSTRFMTEFYEANMRETLAGKIVLTVGMSSKGDCKPTEEQKIALDVLHCQKIDMANEILVLNCGGYVGDSTRREVIHAKKNSKIIRWLEPDAIPLDLRFSEALQ